MIIRFLWVIVFFTTDELVVYDVKNTIKQDSGMNGYSIKESTKGF
jgi:hypothetical protein